MTANKTLRCRGTFHRKRGVCTFGSRVGDNCRALKPVSMCLQRAKSGGGKHRPGEATLQRCTQPVAGDCKSALPAYTQAMLQRKARHAFEATASLRNAASALLLLASPRSWLLHACQLANKPKPARCQRP